MRKLYVTFAVAISSLAIVLALSSHRSMPRQVLAETNRLRMLVLGEGSPTVVFECIGPAYLENWSRVQVAVAEFTRTVAYDHGGYWGSEPGPKPRDARQIARELHAALDHAGVRPPYVLVGYSFGGPYARVYAGTYPVETAGLLLVDPTQEEFMRWLNKRHPEVNVVTEEHVVAQDEWGSQWPSMNQARDARLPVVPMTLISGAKLQDPLNPLARDVQPHWLEAHRAWLRQFPHARHIVTTNSGHNVLFNEPGLVVEAIRELVDQVRRPKVSSREAAKIVK